MNYPATQAILAEEALPVAWVDLDAMRSNLELLQTQMGNRVTLRVASKSVRHVGLLRRLLDWGGDRFQGLMTFTAAETCFLAEQGFDDLLLAYPISRASEAAALAKLAGATTIRVAVDSEEHVALLSHAAQAGGVQLRLCLDIDASWRTLGQHFGVRRSPVRSAEHAMRVAHCIAESPGVLLDSVLAYEAQIAGIREHNPTSRHLDPIRRFIKRRSKPMVLDRRAHVLAALREAGFDIALVNGGGTGSVRFTSGDPSVTEITAGSGFLCPHLFDGYADLPLLPAAFFALAVSRVSDEGFVTCAGGGFIASGSAGPDRLPIVHLPEGMAPLDLEGFGEVQTPLTLGKTALRVGDPVVCRHAKGGELAERFAEYLLVEDGVIVAREPTYRGMGQCFG
ncbi:MAG: alanine racemase [Proteobacteria bacterium]|nr:alanine racemase [Pseudomonadota bacterium]